MNLMFPWGKIRSFSWSNSGKEESSVCVCIIVVKILNVVSSGPLRAASATPGFLLGPTPLRAPHQLKEVAWPNRGRLISSSAPPVVTNFDCQPKCMCLFLAGPKEIGSILEGPPSLTSSQCIDFHSRKTNMIPVNRNL